MVDELMVMFRELPRLTQGMIVLGLLAPLLVWLSFNKTPSKPPPPKPPAKKRKVTIEIED